jgi:titin
VEIGCNVATGVNSVYLVSLTGLTVGNLYYYRVFGSASNVEQTTGTFCFCGLAGLANGALAANLASFLAYAYSRDINARWSTSTGSSATSFELERSYDGIHFSNIGIIPANANPTLHYSYMLTDLGQTKDRVFYRLKINNLTGQPEYSGIIRVIYFLKPNSMYKLV